MAEETNTENEEHAVAGTFAVEELTVVVPSLLIESALIDAVVK